MSAIWVPSKLSELTGNIVAVSPTSSTKTVVVRGAVSQSVALQEWQDSSGTVLASVNKNGCVVNSDKTPNLYRCTTTLGADASFAYTTNGGADFSGHTDNILYWGYNLSTFNTGGNPYYNAAEPTFYDSFESDYYDGTNHLSEHNLEGHGPSNAWSYRWRTFSFNRATGVGSWIHAGSYHGFTSNDGLTAYLTVGADYTHGSPTLMVRSTIPIVSSSTVDATKYTLGNAYQLAAGTNSNNGSVISGYNLAESAGAIVAAVNGNASGVQSNASGYVEIFSDTGKTAGGSVAKIADTYNGKLRVFGSGSYTGSLTTTGVGDTTNANAIVFNGGKVGINTGSASGQLHVVSSAAGVKPLVVQGASSQTANLQEWQDSSGNVLGSFSPTRFAVATSGGSTLFEVDTNSAKYGFGISGYTTNTLRIGVGVTALYTDNSGLVSIGGAVYTPSAQLDVRASSSSTKALVVRGAASQSANLQEWQDSSGTAMNRISADGKTYWGTAELNAAHNFYNGYMPRVAAFQCNAAAAGEAVVSVATGNLVSGDYYVIHAGGWSTGNAYMHVHNSGSGDAVVEAMAYSSGGAYVRTGVNGGQNWAAGLDRNTNGYKISAYGTPGILDVAAITPTGGTTLTSLAAATKPLTIVGAPSQSANLQEWQDSDGNMTVSVRGASGAHGHIMMSSPAGQGAGSGIDFYSNNQAYSGLIQLDGSGNVVLRNNNSGGGVYVDFTNGAFFRSAAGTPLTLNASGSGAAAVVTPAAATDKGLVVRGAPSQSANLQEWQNSSGSARVAVNSIGYVGIGTGNPVSTLHLYGSCTFWMGLEDGYGNVYSQQTIDTSNNTLTFQVVKEGIEYGDILLNPYGGSVGIGTSTPGAKLDVFDSASTNLQVRIRNNKFDSTSNTAELVFAARSGGQLFDRAKIVAKSVNTGNYRTAMDFQTIDGATGVFTSRLYIDSDGNVGVSTASPGASLHASCPTSSAKGLIVQGAASQTANLTEWQDSSGTVLAGVTYNGIVYSGVASGDFGVGIECGQANAAIQARGSGNPQLRANSTSGAISKMQAIGNSFGLVGTETNHPFKLYTNQNACVYFDTTGYVGVGNFAATGQLEVRASAASTKAFIARAATSQTANLTEWQDSSGTALSSVDKSGYICVPTGSGAPATNPTSGGGLYYDTANGKLYAWDGSAWKSVNLT